MRVAIIGGGVAGLVTARVLRHHGFQVSMFEKDSTVGGVWSASRAYPGLRTNNPAPTYAFSDFPHPEDSDDFPTAAQVRVYLEAYARHFDLEKELHLNTEVVAVERRPDNGRGTHPGFRVVTRPAQGQADTGEAAQQSYEVDFVAVCNGVLSRPHVPDFAGSARFPGQIIHSSGLARAGNLRDKRVVVIGAGKSALDCATHAAREARTCTLLFRRPYWMLPRYFFGRIRVDRMAFNRITELLAFTTYHSLSSAEYRLRRMATPLRPLLGLFRALQCRLVAWQSGIPRFMRPDGPIHRYIYHQGIGPEFYQYLARDHVTAIRGGVDRFTEESQLQVSSGETIAADLVICATGWQQHIDFLEPHLRKAVRPDGCFRLYRHILPPAEPRLGFIGYASSGNTPLTTEIAAHWLARHFRGQLPLPNRAEMERDIDRVLAWTEKTFPEQPEGHFIGAYIAHFIDWLMRDMGLATRRCKTLREEWLGPFHASRYRHLYEDSESSR